MRGQQPKASGSAGGYLLYLLIQIGTYGVVFYLPTEVSALMHKPAGLEVGTVAAIPWICAAVAVFWLPRIADRRRSHAPIAAVILAVAGGASFAFPTAKPLAGMAFLSIAASGVIAVQPIFWTFPTGYLADRAAAGGIAIVTMGNLGGFFGPYMKVWAEDYFHSPNAGLYLLAALTLANSVLVAVIPKHHKRDQPDQRLRAASEAEAGKR